MSITASPSLDLTKFNNVFCDSKLALDWAYQHGLSKKAQIRTSSPAMLWLDNTNIKHIESRWTVEEMKRFQTTIYKFSKDVYDAASIVPNISREEIVCITQTAVHFQKVLFKAACLEEKDFQDLRLFIKVDGDGGPGGNRMNSPWEDFLLTNKNFITHTYKLSDSNHSQLTTSGASRWSRIKLGGLEAVVFRVAIRFMKFLPNWLFRHQVLIHNENELLIEIVANLIMRGFKVSKVSPGDIKNTQGIKRDRSELIQSIDLVITNRIKQWVTPACVAICRDLLISKVINQLGNFDELSARWRYTINHYHAGLIFMNSPTNVSGQALSATCKTLGMPIISAQHGLSIGLSALHNEVSISFDNSISDAVFVYSKKVREIERKSYFSKGDLFVVGMSLRHIRMNKRKSRRRAIAPPIVYISTNLYNGNVGMFVTWLTDYDCAKKEQQLLTEVLSKLPHKVRYKPYPLDNLRYADDDPVLSELANYNNIETFDQKVDMRYLIEDHRVLITSVATSTLSWAVMSDKPVIFINQRDNGPLTDEAYESLSKGLFVFNDSDVNFYENIRNFLAQPIEEIERLWEEKKNMRKKIIKEYFSSYLSASAGRRAARIIVDNYLS